MFPRKERIPRDLIPTALKGRRLSSEHFSIVVPKEGCLPSGVLGYAVIVSKKTARLSVTRHRIKRQVLAALKTTPRPKSLLVFPKTSVSSVSYTDIKTELATLISKINNS